MSHGYAFLDQVSTCWPPHYSAAVFSGQTTHLYETFHAVIPADEFVTFSASMFHFLLFCTLPCDIQRWWSRHRSGPYCQQRPGYCRHMWNDLRLLRLESTMDHYGRHGLAERPCMCLLCGRGRGFRRIAPLLCSRAKNGLWSSITRHLLCLTAFGRAEVTHLDARKRNLPLFCHPIFATHSAYKAAATQQTGYK